LDIEPSTDEQVIMDSNKGWHRAVYIPPQPGRLISIMAQPVNLQIIIRAAIRRVMGDIIFENTYVSSDEVIAYNQKTLSTVAKELEKEQYAIRFAKDSSFAVVVGRVVCFFSIIHVHLIYLFSWVAVSQPSADTSKRSLLAKLKVSISLSDLTAR
jgi:hypothetical protein